MIYLYSTNNFLVRLGQGFGSKTSLLQDITYTHKFSKVFPIKYRSKAENRLICFAKKWKAKYENKQSKKERLAYQSKKEEARRWKQWKQ